MLLDAVETWAHFSIAVAYVCRLFAEDTLYKYICNLFLLTKNMQSALIYD